MSRLTLLALALFPAFAAAQPDAMPAGAMLRLRHANSVNFSILSPDGKILAAAVGSKLSAWDTKSGKEIWHTTLCEPVGPRAAAFSPDGKALAACGDFSTVRFYDPRTGKEAMAAKPLEGRNDWWTIDYSPDGKHLVTAGAQRIGFWDAGTGKQLSQPAYSAPTIIMRVHFLHDSKKLAATSRGSNQIQFWDPVAAKLIDSIKPDPRGIEKAMFTADGKSILYCSANTDSSITVWDFAASRETRKFGGNGSGRLMNCFTLSPGGHTMVVAQVNDPVVYLYETATGEPRGRFVGHGGLLYAMAFDQGSRMLVTGATDNSSIIWDLTSAWRDGKYQAGKLSPDELVRTWNQLGQRDGEGAYRAIWKLALSPEESVPFLRDRFRPDKLAAPVPADLAKKLALLDDDDFRVREDALADLKRGLPANGPALRSALSSKISPEAKGRIQLLLGPPIPEPAGGVPRLHGARALEALELARTPAARELFEDLARGHREEWVAQEARLVLNRWRE